MSVSNEAFQVTLDSKNAEIARLNEWRRKVIVAADAILGPISAEFGRVLEESPASDVVIQCEGCEVIIPAAMFQALYRATDT